MLLQIAASGTIAHILEFFFLIIWVGTIIVVITENRNPVKTLAWAMVLVAIKKVFKPSSVRNSFEH